MYLLDLDKIQLGDIILTRSEHRSSLFIQQQGNCRYSHAILYAGESSYIEADGLGVHAMNSARKLFDDPSDAIVLRLKQITEDGITKRAVEFARTLIGTEYSPAEARRSVRETDSPAVETNRQYCSRLVAVAYQSAHVILVKNPDYSTVKDLLDSEQLSHIDNILRKASDQEVEYANEKNTLIEKQMNDTNQILEQARIATQKDIQDFSQLTDFMQHNPGFDKSISDIIKSSGYLDNWQIEMEKNSFHYNYDAFVAKVPNHARHEVGQQLLRMSTSNLDRFNAMLSVYTHLATQFPLEYFKLFNELYTDLVETATKMREVALKATTSYDK